jgi:hypothetical protein
MTTTSKTTTKTTTTTAAAARGAVHVYGLQWITTIMRNVHIATGVFRKQRKARNG